MSDFYILNEDKTISRCSLMEWANFLEEADRSIKRDEINKKTISTVFLGLDHNYSGGDPLVFETMVFDQGQDIYMARYSTRAEAEAGHEVAKQWVIDGCNKEAMYD